MHGPRSISTRATINSNDSNNNNSSNSDVSSNDNNDNTNNSNNNNSTTNRQNNNNNNNNNWSNSKAAEAYFAHVVLYLFTLRNSRIGATAACLSTKPSRTSAEVEACTLPSCPSRHGETGESRAG